MKNNALWLLIAVALVLLPLVSVQAGDRSCGRSCTEVAGCSGDCGDDCGDCCCGNECGREGRECCGDCREAHRMDSAYECRCHGEGCVLGGCAEECCERFRGCEKQERGCTDCGKDCGKHTGRCGPMGSMGLMAPEFHQRMKLQGRIDRELALCRCQEKRLSHIYDASREIEFGLMHRYFTDRSVGIEQINWQLTQLHNRVDRHTRGQLTPLQDAVFPEHEWFNYCMDGWNTGFHPGVDYVIGELGGHGRKHHRKMMPCCFSKD